jgi:hypothetical protein
MCVSETRDKERRRQRQSKGQGKTRAAGRRDGWTGNRDRVREGEGRNGEGS